MIPTAWKKGILGGLGLLLGACATLPPGPSTMVLPGSRKSFEEFQADDGICRGWAGQQTGAIPAQAANQQAVGAAVVGAGVGAAAGALIGAASHNAGPGAAIGAGAGLLLGSAEGASRGQLTGMALQQRYDMAYTQCMYAKGNQVPVAARGLEADYLQHPPPPRRTLNRIPPPPRGSPPPPPPGAG